MSGVLIAVPETARAEDVITDLESLVAYLNVNNSEGSITELSSLTSKTEIRSNPDKPAEAKSVENPYSGSFNGGGIKVVINGKPLFAQLINAKIENIDVGGEIVTPDSSNIGALAKEAVSSEIEKIKAENVVIQNGFNNTGGLVGISTNSIYRNVEVSTSEVVGNSKIGGLVGESLGDTFEEIKIINLSLEGNSKVGGLAGSIANSLATEVAEVKDVIVKNLAITGTGSQIGIVAGQSDNANFAGLEVQNSQVTGTSAVGGLMGKAIDSKVEIVKILNSSVNGTEKVGGVVGESTNSHINLSAIDSSTVVGTSGEVGGLAGNLDSTTVTNVLVKAVEVEGTNQVGGLVGYAETNSDISNSVVKATVSGIESVGGLAGQANASISNVIVIADVSGNSKVGGLVGIQSATDLSIVSASFSGNVSGQTSVGGLVGEAHGQIRDSFSSAAVNGDFNVGGLVGLWYSPDTSTAAIHLYSDGGVSGLSNVGGLVGDLKPYEQYFCSDWPWWSMTCRGLEHWEARYLNFEDIRSSPVVVGNLRVGSIIGSVSLPINSITNDSEIFSIKYPKDGSSAISVGESILASGEPNFRIGMTESKYQFFEYEDPILMASNNQRIGIAAKKNQTVVFLNSDENFGGVHVYTNWPDLQSSTSGIWGQCSSGDLPYLKALEIIDPCIIDLGGGEDSDSSPTDFRSLKLNVSSYSSTSREFAALVTRMLSIGAPLNSNLLSSSGVPGLTPKLLEELNLLVSKINQNIDDNSSVLSRLFESTLVKGLFFNDSLKPSPGTFKAFGITNVTEGMIPEILEVLNLTSESERFQISTVQRIASVKVIQKLLNSQRDLKFLSSIHLLMSGILAKDSRDAVVITRLIKKMPLDEVNSLEKLTGIARDLQLKIDLRTNKLKLRGIRIAA